MMIALKKTAKMGSQPEVILQKVTAMMKRVGENFLIFYRSCCGSFPKGSPTFHKY